MEALTLKNKIGIVFIVFGALLVAGFRWVHPFIIIVGAVMCLLGLGMALYNRRQSTMPDNSSRWTNDGDDD